MAAPIARLAARIPAPGASLQAHITNQPRPAAQFLQRLRHAPAPIIDHGAGDRREARTMSDEKKKKDAGEKPQYDPSGLKAIILGFAGAPFRAAGVLRRRIG